MRIVNTGVEHTNLVMSEPQIPQSRLTQLIWTLRNPTQLKTSISG